MTLGVLRFLRGALATALAGGLWGAVLAAPVPPVAASGDMAPRVRACTLCHGKEGRATQEGYFPRIAGKPAGYLANQLLNFRDGRRSYAPMSHLIEHLTDDYLREMAAHFAALDLPYPQPPAPQAPPAVLERGRALVQQGDAARRIPACVQCHGAALTGVNPAIPGLLGLPRDYLVGQLGAWVSGQRRAHAPDCMADLARRMAGADLVAVTAWLASQPVPAGGQPAAAPAPGETLPLRCGSAVRPP